MMYTREADLRKLKNDLAAWLASSCLEPPQAPERHRRHEGQDCERQQPSNELVCLKKTEAVPRG